MFHLHFSFARRSIQKQQAVRKVSLSPLLTVTLSHSHLSLSDSLPLAAAFSLSGSLPYTFCPFALVLPISPTPPAPAVSRHVLCIRGYCPTCVQKCVCVCKGFAANALSTNMFYALCCLGEYNYVDVNVQYVCVCACVHTHPLLNPSN